MNAGYSRKVPFWLAPETRFARPDVWVMAVLVVGMLLVEVWQSSRMAELCLGLDKTRTTLAAERTRLEFDQTRLSGGMTRSELEPLAARTGMMPVDAHHQIELPSRYLPADAPSPGTGPSRMAWLDRVSRTLVPEATARSRTGS